MFKRTGYKVARPSFPHPVAPPDIDPTGGNTKTVTINCAWLPFIRGALKQLLLESTWSTPESDLTLIKKRVFTLIDLFTECTTVTVPFACEGDARFIPSPFGTWGPYTPEPIGVYVPMAGYQSTIATLGSGRYNGIRVKVHFDAPVQITHINILYDLSKGQVNLGSEGSMAVFDLDNSVVYPPALSFDEMVDGNGQEQIFTGITSTTQNILLILLAASSGSMTDPSPAGLAYIIGATIQGFGADYDCG